MDYMLLYLDEAQSLCKYVSTCMQAQEIRLRERDQRNGHEWPGEIHLKLNTRTTKSRYYTIRYAPMESLMAWPKGSYELMKFIDPSGKMKFELVLRPEVF